MKIVFLDIDGVLNNLASHSNRGTMNRKWHLRIAPECLPPLEWLVQETGALIVMSSSLRSDDFVHWTECLRDIGVPSAIVIGATPRLEAWNGRIYISHARGEEIDAWLRDYEARCGKVQSFVIFDDSEDMAMHASRLIRTDYQTGLTMEDARRAAELLNVPPDDLKASDIECPPKPLIASPVSRRL